MLAAGGCGWRAGGRVELARFVARAEAELVHLGVERAPADAEQTCGGGAVAAALPKRLRDSVGLGEVEPGLESLRPFCRGALAGGGFDEAVELLEVIGGDWAAASLLAVDDCLSSRVVPRCCAPSSFRGAYRVGQGRWASLAYSIFKQIPYQLLAASK